MRTNIFIADMQENSKLKTVLSVKRKLPLFFWFLRLFQTFFCQIILAIILLFADTLSSFIAIHLNQLLYSDRCKQFENHLRKTSPHMFREFCDSLTIHAVVHGPFVLRPLAYQSFITFPLYKKKSEIQQFSLYHSPPLLSEEK